MTRQDLDEVLVIESETLSPWLGTSLLLNLNEGKNRTINVAVQSLGKNIQQIIGWYHIILIFPEAELLKIAVKKSAWGTGVGQQLLNHLIAELTLKRFETLFLEVRTRNQSALKLYKKNGFVEVGYRKAYYANPPDDAVVLHKNLQQLTTIISDKIQ